MASGHGGKRKGAGRKPGTLNARQSEVAERLDKLKCDPIAGLAKIATDAHGRGDETLAAACYRDLMPYIAPKLRMTELNANVGFNPDGLADRLRRAGEVMKVEEAKQRVRDEERFKRAVAVAVERGLAGAAPLTLVEVQALPEIKAVLAQPQQDQPPPVPSPVEAAPPEPPVLHPGGTPGALVHTNPTPYKGARKWRPDLDRQRAREAMAEEMSEPRMTPAADYDPYSQAD